MAAQRMEKRQKEKRKEKTGKIASGS